MLKGSAGKTLVDVGSGYWEFLEVTPSPGLVSVFLQSVFQVGKNKIFLGCQMVS